MSTVYTTNPLEDPRWDALLQRHTRASVFHTTAWLEALRRTYGYEPIVLTTSGPKGELTNGLVLCQVRSWLTGYRLVSLPFSDHCEPLLDDIGREFLDRLRMESRLGDFKFVELRPLSTIHPDRGLQPCDSYCLHELDVRPSLDQIFRGLQKDSIQRKIRRAERERLSYESGRSNQLVDEFFRLLLITRRRHQLPPQPLLWFKHLVECMGTRVNIRVARRQNTPIAAILSLRYGSSVIYKYGCSDEHFHNLGAMPFLFWKLIEESKASGAESIDLGRSDLDNEGLLTFKDRLGAKRRSLTYYRYPSVQKPPVMKTRGSQTIRRCFSILPDALLSTAGRLLYRHIG